MAWAYLLLAGLMEIGWPLGFRLSQLPGWRVPGIALAAACLALSTVLLWFAQKAIPIGTAYAVWTGIGAVGVFIFGILLFGEPRNTLRVASAACILVGIIGLKLADGAA
ncbi:MAG: multidrug efflux SMR transporter [Gammaproteobacteria bacterium]|nr:multidrug efflux SMR transporter [Gammaproteobacteria bacterium]